MQDTFSVRSLAWPVRVSRGGNVITTTDYRRAWADRVRGLVATRIGERAMRSDYGCGVGDNLFHPSPMTTPEQDIRTAMAKWLPRLRVVSADVSRKDAVVEVSVVYQEPDGTAQEIKETFFPGTSGGAA